MKLSVQVPCLNEEKTLPSVIRDIPRHIEGVGEVRVLIINDGSSDYTAEVAYREGADYVINLPYTQGLARAISVGIDRCLELGAEIIVNTDGDHQYEGQDILIKTVSEALKKNGGSSRMMAATWQEAGTVRVCREEPHPTKGGKVSSFQVGSR